MKVKRKKKIFLLDKLKVLTMKPTVFQHILQQNEYTDSTVQLCGHQLDTCGMSQIKVATLSQQ